VNASAASRSGAAAGRAAARRRSMPGAPNIPFVKQPAPASRPGTGAGADGVTLEEQALQCICWQTEGDEFIDEPGERPYPTRRVNEQR
jgi:hypothetical protein